MAAGGVWYGFLKSSGWPGAHHAFSCLGYSCPETSPPWGQVTRVTAAWGDARTAAWEGPEVLPPPWKSLMPVLVGAIRQGPRGLPGRCRLAAQQVVGRLRCFPNWSEALGSHQAAQTSVTLLFSFLNILLFIWLHQFLAAARRIFHLHCSMQDLPLQALGN